MKIGETEELVKVCSDCVHGRGYPDDPLCRHPGRRYDLLDIDDSTAENCKLFQANPELLRYRAPLEPRKVIQMLNVSDTNLIVLCDDGTMWDGIWDGHIKAYKWASVTPVPQEEDGSK